MARRRELADGIMRVKARVEYGETVIDFDLSAAPEFIRQRVNTVIDSMTGKRARKADPAEAQSEPREPTPAEGTQQPDPSPGTGACETWCGTPGNAAKGAFGLDGRWCSVPCFDAGRPIRPSGTTTGTAAQRKEKP